MNTLCLFTYRKGCLLLLLVICLGGCGGDGDDPVRQPVEDPVQTMVWDQSNWDEGTWQ